MNEITTNANGIATRLYYDTNWMWGNVNTYNPETHDLVEKPEAKKIRLEGEKNLMEERIKAAKFSIEAANKLLEQLTKEKKEIAKELKELK